ncbi:hypothetical protein H2199_000744 [Coniosporium tulheliwenetii]|uniref:Uncharacterized protein n=1 Tax=Coniosporium tulheliwenetii TaxID=3383036 RepID=A0ACC2ZMT2_9PEZI|nr:hypothetical protein H2199_000744 [Cladosporium sp. JES 115]
MSSIKSDVEESDSDGVLDLSAAVKNVYLHPHDDRDPPHSESDPEIASTASTDSDPSTDLRDKMSSASSIYSQNSTCGATTASAVFSSTHPGALRVLLIGKGGCEHALTWKLSQSPLVSHVYVVPGNGGTASSMDKVSNITDLPVDDIPDLVARAQELDIGLVVPGPANAVVSGMADHFEEAGIAWFGPVQEVAIIEGSKAWAKAFMKRHDIPTACYSTFGPGYVEYFKATRFLEYLFDNKVNSVIKISDFAPRRRVFFPTDLVEASAVAGKIMLASPYGENGKEIIVEERLEGEEISLLTFSDGVTRRTLPAVQAPKMNSDGDEWRSARAMGGWAPASAATEEVMEDIEEKILKPTFDGFKAEGKTFAGVLLTRIMLTEEGPKVLGYNIRFGDPETQSLLLLLSADTDLMDVLLACVQTRLDEVSIRTIDGYVCNVVVAARGYPGEYDTDKPVSFTARPEGALIFHAGTQLADDEIKTTGGRVVGVAATGETLEAATKNAYAGVRSISFEGMNYRKDIGAE